MAPPWLEDVFVHADLGPLIFNTKQMGIIRRNRLAQSCKELYRLLLPSFKETGKAIKEFGREHVVKHAAALNLQTVLLEAHLELGCPMTWHAAKAAALFDNIEILAFISKLHPLWVYQTILHSARAGSAQCLDYALRLHEQIVRDHPTEVDSVILVDSKHIKTALNFAAMWDQSDTIRVFYHFGFFMTRKVAWYAARSNGIKALTAMLSMNVEKDTGATAAGAERNTHATLEFLRANGWPFPLDSRLPCRAAEYGSLKCLQYLERHGCTFNAEVTKKAAQGGELDALMHLRDRHIPWDERVVTVAVGNGHKNILEFALPNGCPYNLADAHQIYTTMRAIRSRSDSWDRMDKAFDFLKAFDAARQ
jgi:hypothetical protein